MIIYVDFDGTISNDHGFGDPMNGSIDTINALYDAGHHIVIYSCRSNSSVCDPVDHDRMISYLKKYGVKYHHVEHGKPHFTYIIDDRSINPKELGWDSIKEKLLNETN